MENGKTYRIKANPGADNNLHLDLTQNYDTFEILSLKIEQDKNFKLHSSNYGIVVGRVIANGGIGVPNAKISAFIKLSDDDMDNNILREIYPFMSFGDKDESGRRYNVLPNYEVNKCHQAVGSMPSKEYILDNDVILEVFDKYFKLTTRTNDSGDYMLSGVPVGSCSIHMDLDLSDCGILSQRPRDFLYKGHSIEEFESPNQFKKSEDLDYLSQIISENSVIDVIPFWGNESINPKIGITRCDINVTYKFEPTCVFMGSIIGDSRNAGISAKCIPSDNMGNMDELVTGTGTIEIIRKTLTGAVEELQVKGTELIDSDGVWCFQIPMNLDYVATDEYGNLVPTDNPEKGIPTRARVRFRASMKDVAESNDFYFRGKVLIPNNPQKEEDIDYSFGTITKEDSYRDMFWDNVYSVKSYFPRFQKGTKYKTERFTGIKHCNISGNSNPMPYNNLRIKMPFMFTVVCSMIKSYISFLGVYNKLVRFMASITHSLSMAAKHDKYLERMNGYTYGVIKGGFCPDLDNWYFAPRKGDKGDSFDRPGIKAHVNLLENTFRDVADIDATDSTSVDSTQGGEEYECITRETDYLISCVEMNLAQEYKVINFDFYNDWINGVIYFPRWMRKVRKKAKWFFGLATIEEKVKGCMSDSKVFSKNRRYVQQCALEYSKDQEQGLGAYTKISSEPGCTKNRRGKTRQVCHKGNGLKSEKIFNKNGGIVEKERTMFGQYVYYLKPCEFLESGKKVNLFATDIVLLGSLKEQNLYGIPQAFKFMPSTSYQMPTNLALTNVEENGYMYTTSGNSKTLCFNEKGNTPTEQLISSTSSNTSFNDIQDITNGSEDPTLYEGADDTIPTTEVSGISWNFTGYGQGENNFDHLYYPGGHFLGLSCWTSQTNIKSCVNLSRICELGTEMSSRHENVGGAEIDKNTGNPELKRYYLVPNGLIGEDDIVDNDFRTMFSTLNSRKLLYKEIGGRASQIFNFMDTDGFSGEMRDTVRNDYEGYNAKVAISDDMDYDKFFSTDDYDPNEKRRTFRRALENTNLDYYLFRLGLSDVKDSDNKFLLKDGARVALPQYENSFYFYFGLRNGRTAIDRLNRDFFSICQGPSKPEPDIQIEVVYDNIYECEMSADVTINTVNATVPLKAELYDIYNPDVNLIPSSNYWTCMVCGYVHEGGIPPDYCPVCGVPSSFFEYSHGGQAKNDSFNLKMLKFGEYRLIITDNTKKRKEVMIKIGLDEIFYSMNDIPFKVILSPYESKNSIVHKNDKGGRENVGGYIKSAPEITFFNKIIKLSNFGDYKYSFFITDDNGYYTYSNTSKPLTVPDGFSADDRKKIDWVMTKTFDDENYCIHLWDQYARYSIYLGISCNMDKKYSYCKLEEFSLSSRDSFELYHGCDLLPYNGVLHNLNPTWWLNLPSHNNDLNYFNKPVTKLHERCWALRHFCVDRGIDNGEEFDSRIYVKQSGSEIPSLIYSGNPEKYGSEEKRIVPLIGGHDKGSFYFPNFSSDEPYNYPGYDITSEFLGVSTGKFFVGETTYRTWGCLNCGYIHEGTSYPITCPQCGFPGDYYFQEIENSMAKIDRPLNGIIAYSSNLLTFTDIISDDIEIKYDSKGIMYLEASIATSPTTLVEIKEYAKGLKAFLCINDTEFSNVKIIDFIESSPYNKISFIDESGIVEGHVNSGEMNLVSHMVLKPYYYYPYIKAPMKIRGNIVSNSRYRFETPENSCNSPSVFNKTLFEGYIDVYNNNKYMGANAFSEYKSNGNDMSFVKSENIDSNPDIKHVLTEEGKKIYFYEADRKDYVETYKINTDEEDSNDIKIDISEEAPRNYQEIKTENGLKIKLDRISYSGEGSFYEYIFLNSGTNKLITVGETVGVTYYLMDKGYSLFPFEDVDLCRVNTYYDKAYQKYIQDIWGFIPYHKDVEVAMQLVYGDKHNGTLYAIKTAPIKFKKSKEEGKFRLEFHGGTCLIQANDGTEPNCYTNSSTYENEAIEYYMDTFDTYKKFVFDKPPKEVPSDIGKEYQNNKYIYNYIFKDSFFEKTKDKDIQREVDIACEYGLAKKIDGDLNEFSPATLENKYILGIANNDDPDNDVTIYRLYL